MLTGAWLAPGHRVDVMLNGDDTYDRLWEDLRSARRSITLQLYYGSPGRMASTLGEIPRERAGTGVRVLLLMTRCRARVGSMRRRPTFR